MKKTMETNNSESVTSGKIDQGCVHYLKMSLHISDFYCSTLFFESLVSTLKQFYTQ